MVVPAVAISTLLGALNGYVLTKWRFAGHRLVFGMMLFACFIPFQSVIIPMATILGKLGELGQFFTDTIGVSLGFGNSTVNLVMSTPLWPRLHHLFFRNYYEAFPTELVKSAMIDGAGFFQIFWRILLPNSGPIIIVTVIYQFTNIWNDFCSARPSRPATRPDDGGAQQCRQHLDRHHRIQRQHGRRDHRRRADTVRLYRRRTLFRARLMAGAVKG